MAINFSSSLTQIFSYWTLFKELLSSKGLTWQIQYDDDGTQYTIFVFDSSLVYVCNIWKSDVPDGIIQGGYSQAQNDSDRTDFETNYKSSANKRIQRTDTFGNPVQTPIEWAMAFGLLPGAIGGRCSGYVGTSSTGAVVVRATAYTPQGTDAQRSFKSSSANDTAAGTGARKVKIVYLNTSFERKEETVTLNGTAAVNTVATDIAFIESMEVTEVGTQGGGNAGTISIYTLINGGGSVWGSIAASDNKTYWAHHYVPAGKTCYLLNIVSGATIAGRTTINRSGGPLTATAPQLGVAGTYSHLALGSVDHPFKVPIPVVGPDFVWTVERPGSATASTAYADIEYVEF